MSGFCPTITMYYLEDGKTHKLIVINNIYHDTDLSNLEHWEALLTTGTILDGLQQSSSLRGIEGQGKTSHWSEINHSL